MSNPEVSGNIKRFRATISGRVQGVGFRYFVLRHAMELGVDGYVRNLPTGQVEVVAQGDEAKLLELLAACRRGPRAAVVTGVDVQWLEPAEDVPSPFRVAF